MWKMTRPGPGSKALLVPRPQWYWASCQPHTMGVPIRCRLATGSCCRRLRSRPKAHMHTSSTVGKLPAYKRSLPTQRWNLRPPSSLWMLPSRSGERLLPKCWSYEPRSSMQARSSTRNRAFEKPLPSVLPNCALRSTTLLLWHGHPLSLPKG